MPDTIEYADIPYLVEILSYLPLDPVDDEDVQSYIQNITNLIAINYKYEQYQFAYFGIHLLYMTYVYCTIWKISRINPERYCDAVVFAKPYFGRESDFDIENVTSIFEYSIIPEKEISKIFKIIGLDKAQINSVRGLVVIRNDMAHASGKFEILTEESFGVKANSIITSMKNIHNSMDKQIRKWFLDILLRFNGEEFSDYENISDIISEQMIQNFKLSSNELIICNTMSLKAFMEQDGVKATRIKEFKASVSQYCQQLEI